MTHCSHLFLASVRGLESHKGGCAEICGKKITLESLECGYQQQVFQTQVWRLSLGLALRRERSAGNGTFSKSVNFASAPFTR